MEWCAGIWLGDHSCVAERRNYKIFLPESLSNQTKTITGFGSTTTWRCTPLLQHTLGCNQTTRSWMPFSVKDYGAGSYIWMAFTTAPTSHKAQFVTQRMPGLFPIDVPSMRNRAWNIKSLISLLQKIKPGLAEMFLVVGYSCCNAEFNNGALSYFNLWNSQSHPQRALVLHFPCRGLVNLVFKELSVCFNGATWDTETVFQFIQRRNFLWIRAAHPGPSIHFAHWSLRPIICAESIFKVWWEFYLWSRCSLLPYPLPGG